MKIPNHASRSWQGARELPRKGGISASVNAKAKAKAKAKTKSKKKPKPSTSTSLMDFIQDRRKESDKNVRRTGRTRSKGAGTSRSGGAKTVVVSLEKLEEQGLRQKGSSRSKKLSSLKKRIIKERALRSYLLTPSLQPYPLELHPAFIGDADGLVCHDAARTHPAFFAHERSSNQDMKEMKGDEGVEEEEEVELDVEAEAEDMKEEGKVEGEGGESSADLTEAVVKEKEIEMEKKSESKYYHGAVKEPVRVPRTLEKGAGVYRDYVVQAFSLELESALYAMVSKLRDLQRRQQLRDPLKAKLRRRFVVGLREVHKGVKLGKVKCVIIAANIEMGMQGLIEEGIDSVVNGLINACKPNAVVGRREVPIVFAPSRTRLGKALGKHVSISALGVYSPDGANEEYKKVLKLGEELRQLWNDRVEEERASKVWTRCSRCNQVAVKTYYLCQACDATYCLRCKQSLKDRRVSCAKAGSASEEKKDQSCSQTCIAISRAIPVPSNINEQEAMKAGKESTPPKLPQANAKEWSPQNVYISSFGAETGAYGVVYYPQTTANLSPSFVASSPPSPNPYLVSSYAAYPPGFRSIPLSSDAKEFIPRDMKVGATKDGS